MTRFTNLALSAATALGLALAPIAAAAEPDRGDIARTIAGLAVLGIIAKAASDRDDRKSTRSTPRLGSVDDRYDRYERYDRDDRYKRYNRDDRGTIQGEIRRRQELERARGYKNARLPERCLMEVDTGRSIRLVYGGRCLQQSYKFARKLPERCEQFVRTTRGVRSVYGARCLAREGWQVARR